MTPASADVLLAALCHLVAVAGRCGVAIAEGAPLPRTDLARAVLVVELARRRNEVAEGGAARRACLDHLIAAFDALVDAQTTPLWAPDFPAVRDELGACPGPFTAARWLAVLQGDVAGDERARHHHDAARAALEAWRRAAQEIDP